MRFKRDDPVVGLTRFAGKKKDYERIAVREQVEVLALLGDVALQDSKPKLHAHVVLGRRDGSACGGYLLSARVGPSLGVIVSESPAHLKRRHDPQSGLALIDIRA